MASITDQATTGCPDGGTCHHDCVDRCWRVRNAGPFTAYGEDWTAADKARHGDRAPTYEERVADVIAGADPFAGATVIGPAQVAAAAAGPPDPVEILAREIATFRITVDAGTAWAEMLGRPAVTDSDRAIARQMLAALVAGPWHLVIINDPGTARGMVDLEWTP